MWFPVARLMIKNFSSIPKSTNKHLKMTMKKHYKTCDDDAVVAAAEYLQQGLVIAVPTDTIYGLAASAQDLQAIKKLYEIKHRDKEKRFAICVDNVEHISKWGDTSLLPEKLIETLLPGPVTLVLQRTVELNPYLNPDSNLVGIRVPNNKFIRDIAHACQVPLALTSANLNGEPSSLHPMEFQHLWPYLAGVFDGGNLGQDCDRLGSTIVDLSHCGCYKILRPGCALVSTLKVLKNFGLKNIDA